MKVPKTVYVLGAGFSKPAGAPSQEEILREIFRAETVDPQVEERRSRFKSFLIDCLNVPEAKIPSLSLEDIYTPIDRCLADGTSFKGKLQGQLEQLRSDIEFLISEAISHRFSLDKYIDRTYPGKFARYLVEIAQHRASLAEEKHAKAAKDYDPFSVISLNWDILLDNAINDALEAHDNSERNDYGPFGVVDYCCYISSLHKGQWKIRSGLWSLGCRGYNVKLLKLHGSMNWLQCPNCQRLFVEFGKKSNIRNAINSEPCRHCSDHGLTNYLQGSLVMPTFLKDLSNFQVKLVWQNAGVELMEAKNLVFIGYSLPHSDYEFRQLMSRMVHKDTKIQVVLFNDKTPAGSLRYQAECERYSQFFSGHSIEFKQDGVVSYVDNLIAAPKPAYLNSMTPPLSSSVSTSSSPILSPPPKPPSNN